MPTVPLITKDGKLEYVLLDSILFFKKYDDESIVRTFSTIYNNPFSFKDLALILEGHGFEYYDKSLFVKVEKIKRYNSERFLIYFEDEIDKNSINIDINSNKLKVLKKMLPDKDVSCDDGIYSPVTKRKKFSFL
jgi:hypothetical protein